MLPSKFVSAGESFCTYQKPVPAPIFRKSFVASKADKAEVVIGATGFYDLFLNGKKITDGYLAPYISNSEQVIFFDKYDLSGLLCDGENVIGVMLGNGFANPIGGEIWEHDKGRCSAPLFAMSFVSDSVSFEAFDMTWNYSHILFDDCRCGTYCDMTKESKGWCNAGFDDSLWHLPALRDFSDTCLRFRECEPVRDTEHISPISFCKGALRDYRMRDEFSAKLYNGQTVMGKTPMCGGYIYDFGENRAGVVLLKIKGERGQKIHLQFCEFMFEGFADYINIDVYPDGCCQKDVYVCNGEGVEEYIPPFTYHGFRYCYVSGITEEQATKDLLTMIVLHNDVKQKASFSCSDDISERIVAACKRSDLSNILHIITDCPTREKNGWTGDAAISAEHLMQNFAVEKVFSDWLLCIRSAQDGDGRLPLIVPSGDGRFECPIWDSVLVFLPYYAYIYSGNIDIVTENADAMLKNLRFHLANRDERGIVESGLGDWLPVDSAASEYASPLGFCCTALLVEECRMMDVMLSSVGRYDDAEFVRNERNNLIEALRAEYNENGVIGVGKTAKFVKKTYRSCQTSQVLGLYCGIFNCDEKDIAVKTLIKLIKDKNNSFDCGFLGLRYIFRVLSQYGYSDLAYEMITKPDHPSYANMIYRGETSVWERFVPPGGRIGSHNHHFMADVSGWYLECVVGIKVNPGGDDSDSVLVEPQFVSKLDFACGEYDTPGGKACVEWKRFGERIKLSVKAHGQARIKVSDRILSLDNVDVVIE